MRRWTSSHLVDLRRVHGHAFQSHAYLRPDDFYELYETDGDHGYDEDCLIQDIHQQWHEYIHSRCRHARLAHILLKLDRLPDDIVVRVLCFNAGGSEQELKECVSSATVPPRILNGLLFSHADYGRGAPNRSARLPLISAALAVAISPRCANVELVGKRVWKSRRPWRTCQDCLDVASDELNAFILSLSRQPPEHDPMQWVYTELVSRQPLVYDRPARKVNNGFRIHSEFFRDDDFLSRCEVLFHEHMVWRLYLPQLVSLCASNSERGWLYRYCTFLQQCYPAAAAAAAASEDPCSSWEVLYLAKQTVHVCSIPPPPFAFQLLAMIMIVCLGIPAIWSTATGGLMADDMVRLMAFAPVFFAMWLVVPGLGGCYFYYCSRAVGFLLEARGVPLSVSRGFRYENLFVLTLGGISCVPLFWVLALSGP